MTVGRVANDFVSDSVDVSKSMLLRFYAFSLLFAPSSALKISCESWTELIQDCVNQRVVSTKCDHTSPWVRIAKRISLKLACVAFQQFPVDSWLQTS